MWMLLVAILNMACPPLCTGQSETPRGDVIERAWQARQNRLKTAVLKIRIQHTTMRGQEARMSGDPAQVVPPQDMTIDRDYELHLGAQGQARFVRRGMFYERDDGDYIHLEYTDVFDGERSRTLFDRRSARMRGSGFIRPAHNKKAFRALVTDYAYNVPLDRSAFTLTFPPGTIVSDSLAGETYVVGSRRQPAPVSDDLYGMALEDVIARADESTSSPAWPWMGHMLLVGGIILLTLIGIGLFGKRHRGRS